MLTRTITEGHTTESQKTVYKTDKDSPVKQPWLLVNAVIITLVHLWFFWLMLTFPWIKKWDIAFSSYVYSFIGAIGVTAGAHRFFTHRSYKAKLPLKIILLLTYAMAGHHDLYEWVRDHRTHHKYTETDADPHNAKRGFFFSHVGWLYMKKHPDVITKGKTIDMSDISGDPLITWYRKYYTPIKIVFCFIVPTVGMRYIWNEDWFFCFTTQCVSRYILSLNLTWTVNSLAHIYGNQPYDKTVYAKDNHTVSYLSIGEGWHNYHHAFPWDYRASEYGKFNPTTAVLNFFGKIGWAYDFKLAPDRVIKGLVLKSGDGTHEIYGRKDVYEDAPY